MEGSLSRKSKRYIVVRLILELMWMFETLTRGGKAWEVEDLQSKKNEE